MEIKRFGDMRGKTMMLLHGNLMCWRQFEDLIPLLERKFCVYPSLIVRCFPGFGHGEIINHPALLASELERFLADGETEGDALKNQESEIQ